MFILQDEKNRYYLWEPWECELMRVNDEWVKSFDSTEKIMEHLIIYMTFVSRDAEVIEWDREID